MKMPSEEALSSCYRLSTFLWLLAIFTSINAQTLSLSVTPTFPVVGQEVTFTCTASQDFTASTSVFYQRNKVLVGQLNVNSTSCTPGQNSTYTLSCGSLPTRQLSLTIPSAYVTEDQHGTDWICNIFLTNIVSDTVQLTLSVPVSTVTITTDGVYRPSVTISAGNTRTFTCTTTASRPVARLSWFRGDNNITDQAGTATDQGAGDDKYTRQQSLILTGRVNDVDSGLKCEAVNIEGRTPVSSQTSNIIVQWEPQTDPILTRDPPTTTLTEGVSVTLTCQQTGGKPLATLTWSGVCSGTTPTESRDTTTVTSRVQLSVNRTYNGQTCTCESRHPANSYLKSLSETFLVLFGPDEAHFSGISGQLTESTPMNLVCSSNESNPVPIYTWMNGSTDISVTSPVLEIDGVYNGKMTSQTWSTSLSRYDDSVVITCVVTSPGRGHRVSATTTLSVLYQPYITVESTPPSPVIESRQLTLTCDVDSNPDTSGVWSRPGGQPLPGTTQTSGALVITSVSRHDNGTYRCTATNSQKTNMLGIDITVHYPPDQMAIIYNNITYDDVAPRRLRCLPDGNPRSFTFSKWQHLSAYGQLIRELDGVTSGQESVLTIPDPGRDTRYQDTGYYVCRVENGVPDRNSHLVFSQREFFNVKAPPVYGIKPLVYRGQKGKSISISIPFYSTSGYSKVELSRNQSPVSNRFVLNTVPTNLSLTFHGTNITVGGFTTEIYVQALQQEDFGNYTLQVTNDLGVQPFEFYLKASGPPEAPTHLQVTERAVYSIRVEWTAGFDGGSPQQFIVGYASGVSDWINLTQIPHSRTMESATIENLNENKFYRIRLSAVNSIGSSSFVFTNTSTTKTPIKQALGPIIGGAVGGIAIVILVPVVLIILYKRRVATKKGDNAFEMGNGRSPLTKNESGQSPEDGMKDNVLYESAGPREDDRDGMKDNVLYESAGPREDDRDGMKNNSAGPSHKPDSGLYAEVNKKGKGKMKVEPSKENAVVSKEKDTGKSDLYAEVKKPKAKQAKGKGKGKKQGKGKDLAQKDGEMYENVHPASKEIVEEKDNVYANAECKPKTGPPNPGRWKNIDGLEYTDVVFKDTPGEKNGKPIIHGLENRTEYIEVDFSKHAEPLPQEDEEAPKDA